MSIADVHRFSTIKVWTVSYIHQSIDDDYKRIDLNTWDIVSLRRPYMKKGLLSNVRLGIEKPQDDNTIAVYINCNSVGAVFIHATANISIDAMEPVTS
ncbi:hypothetical protein C5167_017180 [Papaver somniferum]|uniref:Uncharacterized protein n=1 Tax=Papaver somniferum TaxID=3469 RepID=A0A4Y7ILT8_PAPSO|nr:hypothetical protein C5167_017180 [Papaver somniferum]